MSFIRCFSSDLSLFCTTSIFTSLPIISLSFAGEEAWKKIEYLRDQRKRNQKKIKDSQKSGASADDVFKPSLWWYNLLDFVEVGVCGRQTSDNLSATVSITYHVT